jgi:hypothetical protein
MYKHLDDCKKCKNHKGMIGSFVKCGYNKEFTAMCPSMPAFYVDDFKNGTPVVNCYGDKCEVKVL